MFEKKNKVTKGAPDLSNKLFPISEPYGYEPDSVNKAVAEMKATIEKQQDYIQKMKSALITQKEQNSKLEEEMRRMQMQLTFSSVPSVNDIQEEYIQNKFNQQFGINEESEESIKQGGIDSLNPETDNKSKNDIINGTKIKIGGKKPEVNDTITPIVENESTSNNDSDETTTFNLEDFL